MTFCFACFLVLINVGIADKELDDLPRGGDLPAALKSIPARNSAASLLAIGKP